MISARAFGKFVWRGGSRNLSLGNPMFISRPVRPTAQNDFTDNGTEENKGSSSGFDILSNHGGKIALFGFSFAAALVYRWFIGGKNRTDLEEQITAESPLHPYESNCLRVSNVMTCCQFSRFETQCREKFLDGHATYDDFVTFMQEQQDFCNIKDGYLIDRMVLNFIESRGESCSARYPISLFLVALSNVVNAPPDDRIALLFDVAKHMTPEELRSSGGSLSGKEGPGEDGDLFCRQENVEALVALLVGAYQIPYEKMITESGVYYPFKLFRKITAPEMVTQGIVNLKPSPYKIGQLSVDEFTELLAGGSVCVWGECYRK